MIEHSPDVPQSSDSAWSDAWDLRVYQEAEARGLIQSAALSALRAEMPEPTPPESDSVETAREAILRWFHANSQHDRYLLNEFETAVVERERTLQGAFKAEVDEHAIAIAAHVENIAANGEAIQWLLDRTRARAEAAEAALEAAQERVETSEALLRRWKGRGDVVLPPFLRRLTADVDAWLAALAQTTDATPRGEA